MSGHSEALPYLIGVENQSAEIDQNDLTEICAAIQRSIVQDFGPAWHVGATVVAFAPGKIPTNYWSVVVQDGIDAPGAAGYHDDNHRRPYAKVDAQAGDISVTLDHEVKEMLADPFGARTWKERQPGTNNKGPRVHVLIEVCDPCEAVTYEKDGITLSDFAYPAYYKAGTHPARTCHVSNLPRRELGHGGYISWHDDQDHWYQQTWFSGPQPSVRSLGKLDLKDGAVSPRSEIDRLTREFRAA